MRLRRNGGRVLAGELGRSADINIGGMSMARRSSTRSILGAALVAGLATLLLGGCAYIQPPPVPRMPRLGVWGGSEDATCAAEIGRAHAALAAAGAAAGDPSATAAAHAASAVAMGEYHACLARRSQP
jgi:hypothetical protein